MRKDYHPIPGYPGNYINKEGRTWYEPDDVEYSRYRTKDGYWWAMLKIKGTNKFERVSLTRLLGMTFIPVPPNLKNRARALWIYQIDGNRDNISLSNLKWAEASEVILAARQRMIDELCVKFKIPDFKNPEEGMYPNAVPCEFKEGYYYIPLARTPIIIDKNGNLFNLVTNTAKNSFYKRKKYKSVYLDWCSGRSWSIHRLVAFLFCPKPLHLKDIPFDELEVNHINGITDDNNYKNLEWVTAAENMKHAWDTGLIDKEIPVLVKNIKTEEIVRYPSKTSLTQDLGVARTTLDHYLSEDKFSGLVFNEVFVFKLDDGKDWPKTVKASYNLTLDNMRLYFVEDIKTRYKYAFNTMDQVCHHFKFNINSYKSYLKRNGFNAPYRNIKRISLEEFRCD